MLLCSSKLPVSEELTADILIDLAIEWITGSRNYNFDNLCWDGSSDYMVEGRNGELFQVGLFDSKQICAIHFRANDNRNLEWTTDFVLDMASHELAFQLYRDAPCGTEYVHPAFDLPYLIKKVIDAGYCRTDNGLQISNRPIVLRDDDENLAADMMLRNQKYSLPVVYMSCVSDGSCVINPYAVADKLRGVAHVFFETTRSLSYKVMAATEGNNPYGGAIEIFYPKGSRRILPSHLEGSHSQKVRFVTNAVFNRLAQERIDSRHSWSQLQVNRLRELLNDNASQREEASNDYEMLENMYEDLLAEKDNQLKELREQLSYQECINGALDAQIAAFDRVPVLVQGEETDLYPGEQRSFLVEMLEREYAAAKEGSRKSHIISALLAANKGENAVEEKRKRLKTCLHGYTRMTPGVRKELESIGFELSDDGKHIKLVFAEDPRYTGTLSKTGSDHRSGDNCAHDFIRDIFN